MCVYTVGSLWGPWVRGLIIEVSGNTGHGSQKYHMPAKDCHQVFIPRKARIQNPVGKSVLTMTSLIIELIIHLAMPTLSFTQ